MSKDFCKDCGMLLSPHTSICTVCGFDNDYDESSDLPLDFGRVPDVRDDSRPDHQQGV